MTEGVFVHERGPSIQLVSGEYFYLLDPRPEDIDIETIAHALANLCRYTGHCREFYSVAQHCVLVSYLVSPENALWGLLHDATEAYFGDISRPLKDAVHDVAPGALRMIEDDIMKAICGRFGLAWPEPVEVKWGDNVALSTERRDLMPAGEGWPNLPEPFPHKIEPLSPTEARSVFMTRFTELTGGL